MRNSKEEQPKNRSLVTVYVASGQPEAQIVKGKLEIQNIPVLLKYESAGVVFGLTIDGLGQVSVQVPADMAQQAREIISTNRA